jgi:hypothetical protein
MCYVAAFLTAVPGIEEKGFEFSKSQKSASTVALGKSHNHYTYSSTELC